MGTQQRVVVLGGSGGVGGAIVAELASRGHDVVSGNRAGDAPAPGGVARVAVDTYERDSVVAACAGADVVVMAAQPPYGTWEGRLEVMVGNVVAGAAAAGARLVMVDNLYMYGAPDGAIGASTPEAATTPSNVLRRAVGEQLLAAHAAGTCRVVIGRFTDYFGPAGANSALAMLAVEPGLAGSTARGLLDLDQPHAVAYLPDAARAFARLVEQDGGDGRAWVLPATAEPTQRELLELVVAELPAPVRVGRLGPVLTRVGAALGRRDARMLTEVAHQFERPWRVDGTAFEAEYGTVEVTPLRDAVAATVAWFAARGRATVAA